MTPSVLTTGGYKARITSGELTPGTKLSRHGCWPSSTTSHRQAITILIETGELRGHQGLGVFVAEAKPGP